MVVQVRTRVCVLVVGCIGRYVRAHMVRLCCCYTRAYIVHQLPGQLTIQQHSTTGINAQEADTTTAAATLYMIYGVRCVVPNHHAHR